MADFNGEGRQTTPLPTKPKQSVLSSAQVEDFLGNQSFLPERRGEKTERGGRPTIQPASQPTAEQPTWREAAADRAAACMAPGHFLRKVVGALARHSHADPDEMSAKIENAKKKRIVGSNSSCNTNGTEDFCSNPIWVQDRRAPPPLRSSATVAGKRWAPLPPPPPSSSARAALESLLCTKKEETEEGSKRRCYRRRDLPSCCLRSSPLLPLLSCIPRGTNEEEEEE